MRLSAIAISFVLVCAPVSVGAIAGMARQSVRAVVRASEAAWKQSKLDQIAQYNAPDCVIHATVPKPDGTFRAEKKTCQEAIDGTRRNLAAFAASGTTYAYDSSSPVIRVEDGKTTARFRVSISIARADKSLVVVMDQIETLRQVDGKSRIAAVDIKTISLTVDGQRKF